MRRGSYLDKQRRVMAPFLPRALRGSSVPLNDEAGKAERAHMALIHKRMQVGLTLGSPTAACGAR